LDFDLHAHDSRIAVKANPPESLPVVLIVVDEDGDGGVGGDVAKALEIRRSLGLGVDREVKVVPVQRKADGHDVRLPFSVRSRQSSHPRSFDQAAHFGRIHDRSVALLPPKQNLAPCGYR
jgi:hypothetical protein